MQRPAVLPPIGLRLARTARAVTQAFEHALAEAGGSSSTWQVLLLVRSQNWGKQSELAEAMGVTGATLTHHLNALEDQGLVRRWRDSSNRRVQNVELTDAGVELFERLREVAARHDARLRSKLSDEEVEHLVELLDRLQAGLAADDPA
jgi:MarR family transcriptional regulator, transcriptional regulator for hemolysin